MRQFGALLIGVTLLGTAAFADAPAKVVPVKIEAKLVTISKPGKDHLKIVADSITFDIDHMPWSNVDTKAKHQHIDFSEDGNAKSITLDGDAAYTVRRDGVAVLTVEADSITVNFSQNSDSPVMDLPEAPAAKSAAPPAPAPANDANAGPTHT